ncbi:hypothetical protein KYG_00607, partial [Acidovorax sp. NO-1]
VVPGKGNMILVMPQDIRVVPGLNPRIRNQRYLDHLARIKRSIIQHGFYQDKPLAGYAGMDGSKPVIFITEGATRLAAAIAAIEEGAPLEYLPLVLKPEGTSMEDLTVAMMRSNEGLDFTPLERAVLCARLRKFGWTFDRIATELDVDASYVHHLLTLAAAPPGIRQMVEKEETTAGTAIEAVRQHGENAEQVLKAALQNSPKKKVTRSMLDGRKKILTKQAPVLYETLEMVSKHEAFQQLPEELRAQIAKLIEQVNVATPSASTAPDDTQAADNLEQAAAA